MYIVSNVEINFVSKMAISAGRELVLNGVSEKAVYVLQLPDK